MMRRISFLTIVSHSLRGVLSLKENRHYKAYKITMVFSSYIEYNAKKPRTREEVKDVVNRVSFQGEDFLRNIELFSLLYLYSLINIFFGPCSDLKG